MKVNLPQLSARFKAVFVPFSIILFLSVLHNYNGFSQTITEPFTTSSTFTVPAGVTSITVECWGGGGGGGNSNNTAANGGAGGGGGAYARKVLTGLTPGTPYTVTVGLGGTGAPANSTTNATDGGDSQFAGSGITTIVAGGGKLGDASGEDTNGTGGNNTGGNGGTATGGDFNYTGGNGGNGGSASGGGGGSSATTSSVGDNGDAGDGNNFDNAGGDVGGNTTDGPGGTGEGTSNAAGGSGTIPGGGGGGSNDNANSAGGAGAAGQIIITYTLPASPRTYYSRIDGNWNTSATWSLSGHTGTAIDVLGIPDPGASDNILIGAGHDVTIPQNVSVQAASVTVSDDNAASTNLFIGDGTNSNNPATLTISGNLIVNQGGIIRLGASQNNATRTAGLNVVDITLNGTGELQLGNTNNTGNVASPTSTVNASGNIALNGTSFLRLGNTNNNNSYSSLTCAGTIAIASGATLTSRSNGGGIHTVDFQSNLTNIGTINFANNTDQVTLDVTGTTNNSGSVTFAANTGVKNFTGAVTNSGSWTSTGLTTTSNLIFNNDVTSSGTFAVGGATFNGSTNQTLSGAGTFSFTNITLNKNGTNLLINQNFSVSGTINWSSDGLFVVDSYSNMTLGSGASITAPGNNRYIQLDGNSGANSQLIRTSTNNVSSLRIFFPIGTTDGGYTPVDLLTNNAVTGSNPDANSTLAVKPIYSASATGQLRRTFQLTVNGNDNTTTLTNGLFYYNAASDVSGGDVLANYNTIWFLDSNTGSWTNVTGTAPGAGFFTAPGTAQPLSNGTYYYTIGNSTPQCALGDQNEYGANSWIGHVYDGANNFQSANYLGRFTEPQNLDESFGGDNVNFPLMSAGCTVNTETFSVRFRMALNVATCGEYAITIGGDDGVRLSVDGGTTWETETLYNDHPYAEVTQNIYLDAGINYLVLEYYENGGQNRVRFNMGAMTGVLVTGGKIGGDQNLCQTSIDPALLNSISAARNCAGNTPTYQWQSSTVSDFSSSVTNISPNGTSSTYDPPSQAIGTLYYRRQAIVGGETVYSNTVTIVAGSPQGDQITAGNNTWIGYVYDGVNNFTTNYLGYLTAAQTFDYSFCGDNCTEVINGCDFNTTTFTIRYRMSFTPATSQGYTFTIGADDGVRLSLDGGATYVLSDWGDHGYQEVTSGVIDLFAGTTYNMVLDFYENGGGNRVRFAYTTGPLPVVWRSFFAERVNNDVLLTWETAQEINNDHFEIERSEDGRHFYTLGEVEGGGNSTTPLAYQYLDKKVSYDERHYYRIRQVDFDGKYEYSAIVAIQPTAESTGSYWVVHPNPFASDDVLKVERTKVNNTSGNVSILIVSTVGQVVFQGSGSIEVLNEQLDKATEYLGTGAYLLQVTDGIRNEMFRIVRY